MIEFSDDSDRIKAALSDKKKSKKNTVDTLLISTRQIAEGLFTDRSYGEQMTSIRSAQELISPIDTLQGIEEEYMGHAGLNHAQAALLWYRDVGLKGGKTLTKWLANDAQDRQHEHKFDPEREVIRIRELVGSVENRLARTGLMINGILYAFDSNNGKFYPEEGKAIDAFEYATTGADRADRADTQKRCLDIHSQFTQEQWARSFASGAFNSVTGTGESRFENPEDFLGALQGLPIPFQWATLVRMGSKQEKNTVAKSVMEALRGNPALSALLNKNYGDIREEHIATS